MSKRIEQQCTFGHEHVRTDLYAKQLKDAKDEAERLRVERDALAAQLGRRIPDLAQEHEELLVHLADALRTGELFGAAYPGAQVTDHTKTGRQRPRSQAPSGGDRHVRNALEHLVRKVDNALTVFESRRLNPPQEQIDFDSGPKRRCWTRGCEFRSRTFTTECPGCGKKAAGTGDGVPRDELQRRVESA